MADDLPRRLTLACAAGRHEQCARVTWGELGPACICECHEGGTREPRDKKPVPVGGLGRATLPKDGGRP